jgi:hypothetical protein
LEIDSGSVHGLVNTQESDVNVAIVAIPADHFHQISRDYLPVAVMNLAVPARPIHADRFSFGELGQQDNVEPKIQLLRK